MPVIMGWAIMWGRIIARELPNFQPEVLKPVVSDISLFYPPYDYFLCVLSHDITEWVRKCYMGHLVLLPPFWNWEWAAPVFLFISDRPRRTHVCWDHRSFLCPTWPPNCAFCRWPPGLPCAHKHFSAVSLVHGTSGFWVTLIILLWLFTLYFLSPELIFLIFQISVKYLTDGFQSGLLLLT